MPCFRPVLTTALAAAAVLPAAAHAQPPGLTTLDQLQAPSQVAGYAGTAMWSQYDAATGQFRLVESVDGAAPTAVPVAERPAPFDVDLGSARDGGPVAVYTRDGDVYRFDLRTATEQKLTTLSSPTDQERDPTVQRGQIAFIRRVGGRDQIRVGNTTSGAGPTKLVVSAPRIDSVELGIKQIAYVQHTDRFEGQAVHIRNLSTGHDQVVFSGKAGGASSTLITKPSFTDDLKSFVWARGRNGDASGNELVRYVLRTGSLQYAHDRTTVISSAFVSDELGAITSSSESADQAPEDTDHAPGAACVDGGNHVDYCTVTTSGEVAFAPAGSN